MEGCVIKAVLTSIACGLVALFIWWWAGVDVFSRGPGPAFAGFSSLVVAGFVMTYPGWRFNR